MKTGTVILIKFPEAKEERYDRSFLHRLYTGTERMEIKNAVEGAYTIIVCALCSSFPLQEQTAVLCLIII